LIGGVQNIIPLSKRQLRGGKKMDHDLGFYWVKYKSHNWEPAQYLGKDWWYTIGSEVEQLTPHVGEVDWEHPIRREGENG
jgi:hypothetical protein